ncbi:MAG: zinc-dependent metalloprotease, partial [Bdellovibrionales bacterium]
LNSLSDITFRVVYHYSLVKLDSLTSANYKKFSYSSSEVNTFGFFNTETLKLDSDNNSTVGSQKVFLNRWAPQKNVVYHLTENFNKPENAKIKAATYRAIESINKTLIAAGTQLHIDLQDASPNMNPGDLRTNSIVMVEEPVNYGILGYGPTAANPKTGEIVHGRTAMYLGVMKTGIKRAYDDLVKERLSKLESAKVKSKVEANSSGQLVPVSSSEGRMSLSNDLIHSKAYTSQFDLNLFAQIKNELSSISIPSVRMSSSNANSSNITSSALTTGGSLSFASKSKLNKEQFKLQERRLSLRDIARISNGSATDAEVRSLTDQILSTNCFYSLENFNIENSIEGEIEKVIDEVGAKPWVQLTDEEKAKVSDTLIPFVWVPTLIHEMGHNLGLRHNFAGSEDKENFYSKEELSQIGSSRAFNYSSVMDYGYSSTNELQLMGKYDIAALRFAYAEKIELNDGALKSVDDFRTSGGELHNYKYCTDEHVAVNPNCNRFDEGTTLTEITRHWINMYESSYFRRNFRNGLLDFSLMDDAKQIQKSSLLFDSLRTIFERYEDIKKTYNLADNAAEWAQIPFLKDLKSAVNMSASFFVHVLQTPDTLCAVAQASAPNQIIAVVPIRSLSSDAISCLDNENIQLNPEYIIVGEAGKSFQSRKDPHSENHFADQIDVRGIWIDKMLAANALVGRITGIELFDEFTDNYLDIADLREPLQKTLSALLLDEAEAQVPIFTTSGEVLVAKIPVQFFNSVESQNSHKIQKPLNPAVQNFFGISEKGIDYQVQLLKILKKELASEKEVSDESSLINSILASTNLPVGTKISSVLSTSIGLNKIFVDPKSEVAGLTLMNRDVVKSFSSLGEEKLKLILADLDKKTPENKSTSSAEKLARKLGADVINRYLEHGFQDATFYERMLSAMATN